MKWMNDWRDPGDPPLTEWEWQLIVRQREEERKKLIEQYKKEDEALIAEVERRIKIRKSKEVKNEDN